MDANAATIHIEDAVGRRIPRGHVTTRLSRALGRLLIRPVIAHVRFSDVNGPKGGADVRCAVLVELPRRPGIRVERVATTTRLAFDASYDRLVRHIERARERWQQARRRPKKYYAARRML